MLLTKKQIYKNLRKAGYSKEKARAWVTVITQGLI